MYGKVLYRKPPKRGILKTQLDIVFAKLVRLRDKQCVLCGSTWELQAGHVFSRGGFSTRWDKRNCFGQCSKCNSAHNDHPEPYYDWFKQKFGQEAFDQLEYDYHQVKLWNVFDMQDLLNSLRLELKQYE